MVKRSRGGLVVHGRAADGCCVGWLSATLESKSLVGHAMTLRMKDDHERVITPPHPFNDWQVHAVEIAVEGEEGALSVSNVDLLPPLRNPAMLEGIDDLTSLTYLHEPAGCLFRADYCFTPHPLALITVIGITF